MKSYSNKKALTLVGVQKHEDSLTENEAGRVGGGATFIRAASAESNEMRLDAARLMDARLRPRLWLPSASALIELSIEP